MYIHYHCFFLVYFLTGRLNGSIILAILFILPSNKFCISDIYDFNLILSYTKDRSQVSLLYKLLLIKSKDSSPETM